ncbi:hypothetical protein [Agrobacterium bohemicum]|uniref:Uncharacterized protein n=1 Tax=Agrobacterium bohemicum TaxID=2052828 RepID=A0A135P7F0_9HYPH|nr:hypothetical protein [Agrobacterium bohemicum]KXG87359.1 hypothetical protein ATO67_20405 [Agrobacterium bohemicum]
MNRFFSNEAKDVAWRVDQMHANNAIEGVQKDEALAALVEEWNAAGVADDEQVARLVQMAKQRNRAAA